uniref:Potassium channel tetramerisation-type BTB domain-containing protein n=1 Tax=Chromera velia CCMP2878 TaxID=1169474 RepID=A0A0G4H258_9ALVE|eukprot:Cvel_5585.t1-p1 / transcript=Cvel_5585.t1 / gene=Cvel_5585 / organism=Chromera_velia_CCMP2878 / gene_product=hypothetical protein / transcript_product=hypothetical protein / location=Cvel_scaffold262:92254-97264(+) / protein_length=517 / sequence_SO=supercontig / SO=protein_coding / is_pseudo=false
MPSGQHQINFDEHKRRLKRSVDAAEAAIVHRYAELEGRAKMYDRLKKDFDSNFCGDPDEVVQLNVGGTPISDKRGVFTQFKQSGMAALFSGRYDKEMDRDSTGALFLDLDPHAFNSLKEYLAAIKNGRAQVGKTPLMAPEEQHPNVDALIDHFKLRGYLTGQVSDETVAKYKRERRQTMDAASLNPSLEEIAERSQYLGSVIEAFTDMMRTIFQQEKMVAKLEESSDMEHVLEFDGAFAQLYKKKPEDPIEYVNSLDTQFLVKKSTFKLSPFLSGLQRNGKGEVILTNPGSIVNKVLEYLRRRKIKMDDSHVGELMIDEREFNFFNATMKSFGILEDLQKRAKIVQIASNPRPLPLTLDRSRAVRGHDERGGRQGASPSGPQGAIQERYDEWDDPSYGRGGNRFAAPTPPPGGAAGMGSGYPSGYPDRPSSSQGRGGGYPGYDSPHGYGGGGPGPGYGPGPGGYGDPSMMMQGGYGGRGGGGPPMEGLPPGWSPAQWAAYQESKKEMRAAKKGGKKK